MNVVFNCCTKPLVNPLFKGEKTEAKTQTQVKPDAKVPVAVKQQPKKDTLEISNKNPETKCVCECKCETCK